MTWERGGGGGLCCAGNAETWGRARDGLDCTGTGETADWPTEWWRERGDSGDSFKSGPFSYLNLIQPTTAATPACARAATRSLNNATTPPSPLPSPPLPPPPPPYLLTSPRTMSSSPTYPLYNTTYTLHRLSPLHAFPAVTSAAGLTHHAKSLLSILRGDVLRGVRVRDDDNDDDALGRVGRLKSVTWETLPTPGRWFQEPDDDDDDDNDGTDNGPRGVAITFVYEKATYTSLLLLSHPAAEVSEFTSLPLLMTRLPKSLRATLLSYLASTFDTLPQTLPLNSGALKSLLETWLERTFSEDEEGGGAGKDIQVVFSAPVASLKAITITVPRADIAGFFRRGKRMVAAAGEDGGDGEGAFFRALRYYAKAVMGLDVAALGVMKVACGGFVLGVGVPGAAGTAGKVKVFAPRAVTRTGEKAAEALVRGLVEASLVAVPK